MRKKIYRVYGSKREWVSPILVGVLCLIVYEYFKLDFYKFYVYFFVAGIVSFCFYLIGWGTISPQGLLIRFGVFKIRKIFLRWEDIKNISILHVKKKFHIRSGGGYSIPTGEDIKIKALGIETFKQFSDNSQKSIRRLSRNTIFGQHIEINKGENILLLYGEPACGFDFLIKKINGSGYFREQGRRTGSNLE